MNNSRMKRKLSSDEEFENMRKKKKIPRIEPNAGSSTARSSSEDSFYDKLMASCSMKKTAATSEKRKSISPAFKDAGEYDSSTSENYRIKNSASSLWRKRSEFHGFDSKEYNRSTTKNYGVKNTWRKGAASRDSNKRWRSTSSSWRKRSPSPEFRVPSRNNCPTAGNYQMRSPWRKKSISPAFKDFNERKRSTTGDYRIKSPWKKKSASPAFKDFNEHNRSTPVMKKYAEKDYDVEIQEERSRTKYRCYRSRSDSSAMRHFYQKSEGYLKAGKLDKALDYIRKARKLCFEDNYFLSKIYTRRGIIYSEQDYPRCSKRAFMDWERAFQLDEEYLATRKRISSYLFMGANRCYKMKKHNEALTLAEYAYKLERNPTSYTLIKVIKKKLLEREIDRKFPRRNTWTSRKRIPKKKQVICPNSKSKLDKDFDRFKINTQPNSKAKLDKDFDRMTVNTKQPNSKSKLDKDFNRLLRTNTNSKSKLDMDFNRLKPANQRSRLDEDFNKLGALVIEAAKENNYQQALAYINQALKLYDDGIPDDNANMYRELLILQVKISVLIEQERKSSDVNQVSYI